MPIDTQLIIRKINLMSRDLKRLRPISLISFKEYQKNPDYEVLSERYLERIITRMIDVNYHIVSNLGESAPKDYFESFVDLAKLKILPFGFAENLAQSAGMRNRLVHEYDDIDEEKVYQAIKRCFADMPKYLEALQKFLDKKSGGKKLI